MKHRDMQQKIEIIPIDTQAKIIPPNNIDYNLQINVLPLSNVNYDLENVGTLSIHVDYILEDAKKEMLYSRLLYRAIIPFLNLENVQVEINVSVHMHTARIYLNIFYAILQKLQAEYSDVLNELSNKNDFQFILLPQLEQKLKGLQIYLLHNRDEIFACYKICNTPISGRQLYHTIYSVTKQN